MCPLYRLYREIEKKDDCPFPIQIYAGLMFALLFASAAGATGGVFGHYGEATTADRVLTPGQETRDKLASYFFKDIGVSVMIGKLTSV